MAIEIETAKKATTRFKGNGFGAVVVVETNEDIESSPRVYPSFATTSWNLLDVKAVRDLLTEILIWSGES